MTLHKLAARARTERGRKTYHLRARGFIPAVVYGVGIQPQNVAVDRNQFSRVYEAAGESSIVELQIDEGAPLHVLIQDRQLDPLRHEFTHIDFRSIDMNKEIETQVELKCIGESAAVKALGGTLILSRDAVSIRALPAKLVRAIEVNITPLSTFDDVIRVRDLHVPEGVKIIEDLELSIATVTPPRSDTEMEALESAVEEDVSVVESAKEKKKEEQEDHEDTDDADSARVEKAPKK